ncbi:MAG TPA: radical SAM protein [Vicinamibacterales bacterium]|nr:radical SAM protein [Vicinamibacterales bacterium]
MLFDLGPRLLTTREVARLVKTAGPEGLTEAERRADAARYQEIRCRSALNRVKGMPFEWTLNPYRGCTHGCHYCFARRYQTQLELGAGDEFSSLIFVKANFVDILRRELDHPKWTRALAALGTATDPYQPIEGHYKLTRGTLQALAAARNPVGLLTKGPMVVRDIDVLQDLMARTSGSSVCVSVPTVDEDAWRALEPGTAHPLQRLRAVRAMVDAGLDAGVLMAPLVPGFSTHPDKIEATLKAIADHGARFVGTNILFLDGGTRDHFMRFLGEEFPALTDRYGQLYASKYVAKDYATRVKTTVGMLEARYGLTARKRRGEDSGASEPMAPGPAQAMLW